MFRVCSFSVHLKFNFPNEILIDEVLFFFKKKSFNYVLLLPINSIPMRIKTSTLMPIGALEFPSLLNRTKMYSLICHTNYTVAITNLQGLESFEVLDTEIRLDIQRN